MSSMEKSNIHNLEGEMLTIETGDSELDNFFKTLDEQTKKAILKLAKKDFQITLLKRMNDPDIISYYNSLNEKTKKTFNDLPIKDKYQLLEKAAKSQKSKKMYSSQFYKDDKKQDKELSVTPRTQNDKIFEIKKTTIPFPEPDIEKDQMITQHEGQAPRELFRQELHDEEIIDKRISKPEAFNKLVDTYYGLSPFLKSKTNYELEVRFGTKSIKQFTKNDYDNVVKFLRSFGFVTNNPAGLNSLRIKCEFLDSTSGRFKMSDVRTEINGLHNIEAYCKTNDIKSIYKSEPNSINFSNKKPFITPDKKIILSDEDPSFRRKELEDFKDQNVWIIRSGEVVSIQPFGALIKIQKDMVGLISQKEIKMKKKRFNVGDEVMVTIERVANDKIFLTLPSES